MPWTVEDPNVWIERGPSGFATLVRHLSYPFTDGADEPALAVGYLRQVKGALGLTDVQIDALIDQAGAEPTGTQLRWAGRIELRGETIVRLIQQTHSRPGLFPQTDVEGAGLRIMMHRSPDRSRLRITSVTSTLRHHFDFGEPDSFVRRVPALSIDDLLQRFGFTPPREAPFVQVSPPIVIHTHEPGLRVGLPTPANTLSTPELGKDYRAYLFRFIPPGVDQPGYEFLARLDGQPLALRPLLTHAQPVANGSGMVFERDPVTSGADFHALPGAPDSRLDPHRTGAGLLELFVPSPGAPWQLEGPRVRIEGYGPGPLPCGAVGSAPPQSPGKDGFNYTVRTNDFAAVNAYHHCQGALRILDEVFGLPVGGGILGYRLPLRVMHRAAISPGNCTDGNCVNAQARIVPAGATAPGPCDTGQLGWPQLQLRFALADLTLDPGAPGHAVTPLGMAADMRVIWHELCHVLIAAATDELEFPFAHSAGDALAAILCDPGSKLAEGELEHRFRGVTYPWVSSPLRRHDRTARQGWSWAGPLGRREGYHEDLHDMAGYAREQVLSSTLFRLYLAVGGDARLGHAPELPRRRAASEYCFYLIARAIAALGPAITVPVGDAGAFAGALMDADVGTTRLLGEDQSAVMPGGRVGGTLHKVIRWAFEQQGLYQPPPGIAGRAGAGAPPPVDVFIDDGRAGGYQPAQDWHARPEAMWNRWTADGLPGQQPPRRDQDNFVYVALGNRGDQPGLADVTVHQATAAPAPSWPDPGWTPLMPAGPASGAVPAGGRTVLGPFRWHPVVAGPIALLGIADAPGDLSNVNPSTLLPCAQLASVLNELVPYDNNLGLVEWTVI